MNQTTEQYQYIYKLYNFYNSELFSGELPEVMITFARNNGASGMFFPNKWKDKKYNPIHEISINPDAISNRNDIDFHQVIVHEMAHLWQFVFGKPSRNGYHNKQWAKKMIEIGLMPTATGSKGGSIIGQNMYDYWLEDGKFVLAFKKLQENNYLPLEPNNDHLFTKEIKEDGAVVFRPILTAKKNKTKRVKYTCNCGSNLWGKPNLTVFCNVCQTPFFENNN